jgi:thiamine-phosphate pyrophosphorylase
VLDTSRPITYLITTGKARPENFDESSRAISIVVAAAVQEGVDLIQVREKQLTGRLLYDLVVRMRSLALRSATRLLVNDRLDIALAAGADGVHLTSTSLLPGVVRERAPQGFLIACSVHSANEAMTVKSDGADLCVYGPVFETPGKGAPQGVGRLHEVCELVKPFPVLAIGGINKRNVQAALDAGAAGIAAIRALNNVEQMKTLISSVTGGPA